MYEGLFNLSIYNLANFSIINVIGGNTMDKRVLTEIHTADIHFGALEPKIQYDILMEQMIRPLYDIQFDAFFINGDIFDHKYMSNSDVVMYALLFVDEVVKLCSKNNATLVLLHGTMSHDADQLKLFYRYINSGVDVRIVEHLQFQDIKGTKVLCIPEEYGKGREYYEQLLYYTQEYDMAVLHGSVKGAVYGANEANLDSTREPIFDINCFDRCNGPILCGHIHTPMVLQNHIYYSGSPLRWCFGEEEEKGFLVCLYDRISHQYTVDFQPIKSFRYDTIHLDDMINMDAKQIIDHIIQIKSNGIDYLKVRFGNASTSTDAVKAYFATKRDIIIDVQDSGFMKVVKENQINNDKFEKYSYMMDNNLSEYDIFTRYINQSMGKEFITTDELIKILSDTL